MIEKEDNRYIDYPKISKNTDGEIIIDGEFEYTTHSLCDGYDDIIISIPTFKDLYSEEELDDIIEKLGQKIKDNMISLYENRYGKSRTVGSEFEFIKFLHDYDIMDELPDLYENEIDLSVDSDTPVNRVHERALYGIFEGIKGDHPNVKFNISEEEILDILSRFSN